MAVNQDFRHLKLSEPEARSLVRKGYRLTKVNFGHELGPVGLCYWNCDTFVIKSPGYEVVHGWMFSIWPKVMVEAVHHSVVRAPNGSLLDATMVELKGKHSCFSVDDSIVPSRVGPEFIPNKYFRILKTPGVDEWISAQRDLLDLQRRFVGEAVAQGAKWTPGEGMVLDEYASALIVAAQQRTQNAYALIDRDLAAAR